MTAPTATMEPHESAPATQQRPGAWSNGGNPLNENQATGGPGSRGPYRLKNPVRSYDERLAERMAPQPPCRCGCGTPAPWYTSRGRWQQFAPGHRRPVRPHWDRDWLYSEYVERCRTFEQIAADCGVTRGAVSSQARRFEIPTRSRSESRIGRMVGVKNPAWRGGVADWDYAAGWKVIARKIRDRDEWTCQDCGEQRKRWGHALHVHHIDGNKLNDEPGNLISLCAGCHYRRHARGGDA